MFTPSQLLVTYWLLVIGYCLLNIGYQLLAIVGWPRAGAVDSHLFFNQLKCQEGAARQLLKLAAEILYRKN